MNSGATIHWLRVLIGGFLAEASVIAVVIPVFLLFGQRAVAYAALSGSLVMCFLFALWVGRRVDSRLVLHGILVGVVATILYVGLTRGRPEPFRLSSRACFENSRRSGGRFLRGAPTKGDECRGSRCRLGLLEIQHHNNRSEELAV
jgi:hypothetical protein